MTTQDLQNTKNINMQVLIYDEQITHLGSHFSISRPLKVSNTAHGVQYRLSFIKNLLNEYLLFILFDF